MRQRTISAQLPLDIFDNIVRINFLKCRVLPTFLYSPELLTDTETAEDTIED